MIFSMQVVPGYQRMGSHARQKLLELGEKGELHRRVQVRELASGAWRVTDGESTFIIYGDGEHDRIASR